MVPEADLSSDPLCCRLRASAVSDDGCQALSSALSSGAPPHSAQVCKPGPSEPGVADTSAQLSLSPSTFRTARASSWGSVGGSPQHVPEEGLSLCSLCVLRTD